MEASDSMRTAGFAADMCGGWKRAMHTARRGKLKIAGNIGCVANVGYVGLTDISDTLRYRPQVSRRSGHGGEAG